MCSYHMGCDCTISCYLVLYGHTNEWTSTNYEDYPLMKMVKI